jgi:mannose-6-phosphate isomerase-like protein (cupin superfamily)
MKIRSETNTQWFNRPTFRGVIYIDKVEEKGFTIFKIYIDGKHPKKRILEGNIRTYYIISGTGYFTINDTLSSVKSGDLITLEPGDVYEYEGDEMRLLETNISPDNSFGDEKL